MAAAIAWIVVVLVTVPVAMFVLECLLGAEAGPVPAARPSPPPFAVIMPAHDEARGIVETLAAARAQLRGGDRLIVVADNCTDDTAALARGMGVDVVERDCPDLRGKGFALAAGRTALLDAPPAVVIVLDADSHPADGALVRLAAEAAATGAAVQGCYLLTPATTGGVLGQLSTFAFAVKNLVRQRGLSRLGAPALLQGSGMAFPWPMFAAARLASANLVEDLELGLDLVRGGHRVSFLAEALFTSAPTALKATRTQRTRWEHGTVATGWRAVVPLLATALNGRFALAWLALDLIVPPLALLVVLLALAFAFAAGVALSGGTMAPLFASLGTVVAFIAAVGVAWHHAGRDHLPARSLWRVPAYVMWKLPIYWRLLVDRQRLWVRTSRDG